MTDVRFIASVHPALAAGLYSVRVGQRLQSGDLDAKFGSLAGAPDLLVDASGPRTQLAADAVVSRFPVPGSSGHHAGTLAHAVLADPTLPWLRTPWTDDGVDSSAAWLALVLLGGDEIEAAGRRTTTVGQLGGDRDPGERDDAVVALLSLPADLAATVLPTPDDLPFLSHVRETDGEDAGVHAVVVCNRLPQAGARNEVHLVSLNGVPFPHPPGKAVELVTLAHWQFECVDGGTDFRDLALALAHNCGPLRQETGVTAADDQLCRGVVTLPYRGAPGWYRGPLAPAPDDPTVRALAAAFQHGLPVRAEELLVYDGNLQMVDATYAVAWDLGRALTLADGHAALALDAFWRARRRRDHAEGQLQGLVGHRLPGAEPSPEMVAWFDSLFQLRVVPSRYLVPDPDRLVPATVARWDDGAGGERRAAGRIAFFTVDPVWVTLMAFGAMAIGTQTAHDRAEMAKMSMQGPSFQGFVLRSELVRWEDLRLRVWAGPVDDDTTTGTTPLATVERDLGADLRLVLVPSGAASLTVEVGRAPHGLHFGVEEAGHKLPRDDAGVTDTRHPVPVPMRDGADGTIAVAGLAANLKAADAATFARHMVLGSPAIRFGLDSQAVG